MSSDIRAVAAVAVHAPLSLNIQYAGTGGRITGLGDGCGCGVPAQSASARIMAHANIARTISRRIGNAPEESSSF
jgi:hypothetical protein